MFCVYYFLRKMFLKLTLWGYGLQSPLKEPEIRILLYMGWGLNHDNYFFWQDWLITKTHWKYKWKWMVLDALGCMKNAILYVCHDLIRNLLILIYTIKLFPQTPFKFTTGDYYLNTRIYCIRIFVHLLNLFMLQYQVKNIIQILILDDITNSFNIIHFNPLNNRFLKTKVLKSLKIPKCSF